MSNKDPRAEARARADKRAATAARRARHEPKRAAARAKRGSDPNQVTKDELRAL